MKHKSFFSCHSMAYWGCAQGTGAPRELADGRVVGNGDVRGICLKSGFKNVPEVWIHWVSLNGGFPPISHPKCWSFLVGKPMVVWYHHFRKWLFGTTILGTPHWTHDLIHGSDRIFRKSSRKLDDKIWQSWGFEPCRWKSRWKDEAKHLFQTWSPQKSGHDGIVWLSWILWRFYVCNQFSLIFVALEVLGLYFFPSVQAVSLHHPTGIPETGSSPSDLDSAFASLGSSSVDFGCFQK